MAFRKCLVRLLLDPSKAGRPAPQKKPRTKAKPFQTATVFNPILARRSYLPLGLPLRRGLTRLPKLPGLLELLGLPGLRIGPLAPKAPAAPGAPKAPTAHEAHMAPKAPRASEILRLLVLVGVIGLVGLVEISKPVAFLGLLWLTRLLGLLELNGSILGRRAPPWAATLGFLARMPSLAWASERSRAEPQESSSPSPQGRVV